MAFVLAALHPPTTSDFLFPEPVSPTTTTAALQTQRSADLSPMAPRAEPISAEVADVVLTPLPASPIPPIPQPEPLPGCDSWCLGVIAAYQASEAGNMAEVIRLAANANQVPELYGWAMATAACESGMNPNAYSGFYEGLFQHAPSYWPARAAAAGFGGASAFDPVANSFTTLWMRSAGYAASHWPVCGR